MTKANICAIMKVRGQFLGVSALRPKGVHGLGKSHTERCGIFLYPHVARREPLRCCGSCASAAALQAPLVGAHAAPTPLVGAALPEPLKTLPLRQQGHTPRMPKLGIRRAGLVGGAYSPPLLTPLSRATMPGTSSVWRSRACGSAFFANSPAYAVQFAAPRPRRSSFGAGSPPSQSGQF